MAKKDVYPITEHLRRMVQKVMEEKEKKVNPIAKQYIDRMVDTLGEYEHGTADVEDVFEHVLKVKDTEQGLRIYRAVLQDVILTLAYTEEK